MNKFIAKKIDGILLLDKPLHITSNGALQRIKRLFGAKKAGHTGSLDPLATGMLPICFGEATKFSQYLLESDKSYEVTIQLGIKTSTGDAEGDVIAERPVPDFSAADINAVLAQFIGQIQQIPPMFSALKYQGKPLYELARAGIEVERTARTVHIQELQLVSLTHDSIALSVHCTKGTYIRTLAEDIGEKLGCGAHVIQLRRPFVMPYQQDQLYTLAEIEAMREQHGLDALMSCLLPIESSVRDLPLVKLSVSAEFYLRTGQPVMVAHLSTHGLVRLFSQQGQFLGVGEVMEDGRVAPRRLISQPDRMAKAV